MLVIPAYRESADLLGKLSTLNTALGDVLVIVVLNRPESSHDNANTALRKALLDLPGLQQLAAGYAIASISPGVTVLCADLESITGPTPADRGVGLARKTGCDIALHWINSGAIGSDWICSTDADAVLPNDYFASLSASPADSAAVLFPFRHLADGDPATDEACLRYELRLHHYVLGLGYAQSPYAYHSLGSCIAVRAKSYAQVRGFPPRAAAEDFYLLNKLSKTGPLIQLAGDCIGLSARQSDRVPFGTGPAVKNLARSEPMADAKLYYDPRCFDGLRALLAEVPGLYTIDTHALTHSLAGQGLRPEDVERVVDVLRKMGLDDALRHCRRQSKDADTFVRHFHQWFDGFRTLKFIHGLRDAKLPDLSLQQLADSRRDFWPGGIDAEHPRMCLDRILENWQWLSDDRAR